jgi:hypothetical protein
MYSNKSDSDYSSDYSNTSYYSSGHPDSTSDHTHKSSSDHTHKSSSDHTNTHNHNNHIHHPHYNYYP